jgi:hypothetical protein
MANGGSARALRCGGRPGCGGRRRVAGGRAGGRVRVCANSRGRTAGCDESDEVGSFGRLFLLAVPVSVCLASFFGLVPLAVACPPRCPPFGVSLPITSSF